MSRATRRSILQQVAIFAVVGPPLGGVLGFLQWARFDSETAFLIAGLSYVLVLPVIAAAGAGLMCALMCRRLYRERGPSPLPSRNRRAERPVFGWVGRVAHSGRWRLVHGLGSRSDPGLGAKRAMGRRRLRIACVALQVTLVANNYNRVAAQGDAASSDVWLRCIRGNASKKRAPLPGAELTSTKPPAWRTALYTCVKPSPAPLPASLVVK